MAKPDFLAVGHVVHDLQPAGWRLGGTVTFAAVQAQRLGYTPAIVTSAGPEVVFSSELPGVEIRTKPSAKTTTFENVYHGSLRRQRVLEQALVLEPRDLPSAYGSLPVVLLGPVCGELIGLWSSRFDRSLIGVSAQGWLRKIGPESQVQRIPWTGEPFWTGCDVLFVSEEDLDGHPDQVDRWMQTVGIVALTRAGRGARIFEGGTSKAIDGFPAEERDPTGAGDVFAAAFLLRYHESRQTEEAARFASAAAAFSVEGAGVEAIAGRDQIERRMTRYPEIALV